MRRHGLMSVAAAMLGLSSLSGATTAFAARFGDLDATGGRLDELNAALKDFDDARAAQGANPAKARQLYESCAQRLEGTISGGLRNGYVEYNLGNAYYQLGRIGEAILHYRRAERYVPRDDDLRANLAAARKRCLTYIPPTRSDAVLRGLFFWHYGTSWRSRAWIALGANVTMCACAVAFVLTRRRWLLRAAAICALVLAATAASVIVQSVAERRTPPGVVIQSDVALLKGPGPGYERVVEQSLQPGVEFILQQRRGDWWRIELPDGRSGYVPSRSSALVIPSPIP